MRYSPEWSVADGLFYSWRRWASISRSTGFRMLESGSLLPSGVAIPVAFLAEGVVVVDQPKLESVVAVHFGNDLT